MSNKTKKFAIGTMLAAIAGYLAGLLTAPKSGKETREDIKQTTQKGWAEAEKQLKSLHTELNKLIEQAKSKSSELNDKTRQELDMVTDKAKEAKEKARELLSALHEGDAEDEDLRKAIADATKAIDHLREFLSK